MSLNMIPPKNTTENLLLSIAKNCETFFRRIHTKPQETPEFEFTKPRETFLFNPPLSIEGSCMIGLTSLEVYISIFKILEQNNKFERFTDIYIEFSFMGLKDFHFWK